jgi:hypothetical protein
MCPKLIFIFDTDQAQIYSVSQTNYLHTIFLEDDIASRESFKKVEKEKKYWK